MEQESAQGKMWEGKILKAFLHVFRVHQKEESFSRLRSIMILSRGLLSSFSRGLHCMAERI